MNDNNVVILKDGKELPLPPENPVDDGIVVPTPPADQK